MLRVVKQWVRLPREVVSGRCHIPGNIQGKVGWGSEQHPLAEYVPTYHKGLGLDDLWRCFTTQRFLCFNDLIHHKCCEKELFTEIRAFKKAWILVSNYWYLFNHWENNNFWLGVCYETKHVRMARLCPAVFVVT